MEPAGGAAVREERAHVREQVHPEQPLLVEVLAADVV
jgi:hypothetical protein